MAATKKAKTAKKAPTKKAPVKKAVKTKPAASAAAPKKALVKKAAQKKANGAASRTSARRVAPAPRKKGEARAPDSTLFKSARDVKLLVVDDEPEVLELIVPYLKKLGYTVSEAQDGDQALEKILTERPNIVILDVMMPGLSGWEISRYVRERAELDPVRIIMATGIGKETNAATSPLYGADASIDKPFRLDALHRKVREVIEKIERGAF